VPGLLRQYFPKGTDLSIVTQATLNAVALRLNTRPRKKLGFMTPAEKLAEPLQRSVEPTGVFLGFFSQMAARVGGHRVFLRSILPTTYLS
jgi:hypothetical protein